MKIRLSIIGPDVLAQVRHGVELLQGAVDAGDMDAVDDATDKLLRLTANCPSVELSEEAWRAFLEGIRRGDPGFESGYILPGSVCTAVFPEAMASDHVLELPLDGGAGGEETCV